MQKFINPIELAKILTSLEERFGLKPELFSQKILLRGKHKIWMVSKQAEQLFDAKIPIEKWGMRALTGRSFPYKPSTPFAQAYGHLAKRGIVYLTKEQLKIYFQGETQQCLCHDGRGSVLVSDGHFVVGTAFFTGDQLESQFPKADRQEMLSYYRSFLERGEG